MENYIQKFRQSSIVFEKSGNLLEKLKTLTSSNNLHIFLTETSPTYQFLQECWSGLFLFCLDHELLAKIKEDLVSTQPQKPGFYIFTNNPRPNITQDLSEIKKSRTILCNIVK